MFLILKRVKKRRRFDVQLTSLSSQSYPSTRMIYWFLMMSQPCLPTNETIEILVDKAFTNDWFNQTYDLNLQKEQLAKLLGIATTKQLFQFNGQLYEQIDGVAMGSPLGPKMCHLEDKLTRDGVMPALYRRHVDDTLARMPSTEAATDFLTTLNSLHPSLSFTIEFPDNNKIPFF